MDDIVKVLDFADDDYCIAFFRDGSRKAYAMYEPKSVAEFKEYCHEKGIIRQSGQAVEYSRDPKFRSL